MKTLILGSMLCCIPTLALAQESMHMHHDMPMQASDDGTKPKPADYHSPAKPTPEGQQIRKYAVDDEGAPQENFDVVSMHDNEPFFQVIADRLEYRNNGDNEVVLWDADAWYGADYNKLYLESEGEWNTNGTTESAQLEVFWNHTITTYWDTQLGLRHDFKPEQSRSFLAAGVQGMAPYVFEVDATAYVSEDGDPSAVLELERDFYFTQRIALQPRMETEFAFTDVPEYNVGAGFTNIEAGLRLRYEISRKFAPYVGVSWEQALGESKHMIETAGEDSSNTAFVAGMKLWF